DHPASLRAQVDAVVGTDANLLTVGAGDGDPVDAVGGEGSRRVDVAGPRAGRELSGDGSCDGGPQSFHVVALGQRKADPPEGATGTVGGVEDLTDPACVLHLPLRVASLDHLAVG